MHFMQNKALNRVLASSVAALLVTTGLNAIPRDPCEPPPPAVCCETPRPGPFAFAYPFDMDLNCPQDFYVHLDALYMQAKQEGMEFAIRNTTTAGSTVSDGRVIGFSTDKDSWDWNPGMRFGLGFYLNHDAWQLDFNWTWLNITNYATGLALGGGTIIPLWLEGSGNAAAVRNGSSSSATWHAWYNVFDIALSKPYYVSRYLVLNPHFGLRGGWIDQHFSLDYQGFSGTYTRTIMHGDNDFWGAGIRVGVNSDWILSKGWVLFGNVAASLLGGSFDVTQAQNQSGADDITIRDEHFQNVANVDMALGIGWGCYFNKKRNHISLRAAYEFHEWFDQLVMRKFFSGSATYANDTVSRGNFTLNGVSFQLQFDI